MCLEENPVGKPDAVAPHVRFDERGWETGLYATAPILDSTEWTQIQPSCERTQRLFEGMRVPEFQPFARQAEKCLRVLDAADTLEALMMLPSNRFKALGGDRQDQFSIRINNQWRICFEWGSAGPENVEIVDYH